jgi:hypothetical protein
VNVRGDTLFVLKMLQGRDPGWAQQVFFAEFDAQASWLDELRPAWNGPEFFFEPSIRAMYDGRWRPEWMAGDDSSEQLTA